MAEKSRVYSRYKWLVDIIQRNDGITFEEIDRAWQRSSLNTVPYSPLTARTFHRHKRDIEEVFGIIIKCNKSSNKYYIDNEDEVEEGKIQEWMLSTIAVDNMLMESRDLRDRIQFEDIPGGRRFLDVVINAMRGNKVLHMVYQSFWSDEHQDTWLRPYFLKIFQQRWYVVGVPGTHPNTLRTYALDRMVSLEITPEKFKYPKRFNPSAYYANCYGIFHQEGEPEKIILKVQDDQVKYFDSLKVHHSQSKRDDLKEEGYTYYEYRIAPAYDFVQFLCSKCASVEVIEPLELRRWVAEELKKGIEKYTNK